MSLPASVNKPEQILDDIIICLRSIGWYYPNKFLFDLNISFSGNGRCVNEHIGITLTLLTTI